MINMMYNYGGLNYHKFKDVVDIVTWDNYPTWHKGPESLTAMDTGMQHDIMRSILKKPFLLMESCPSATNWQSVSKLEKTGYAAGSIPAGSGSWFRQCTVFPASSEPGVQREIPMALLTITVGEDTSVFGEVTEVGAANDAPR